MTQLANEWEAINPAEHFKEQGYSIIRTSTQLVLNIWNSLLRYYNIRIYIYRCILSYYLFLLETSQWVWSSIGVGCMGGVGGACSGYINWFQSQKWNLKFMQT